MTAHTDIKSSSLVSELIIHIPLVHSNILLVITQHMQEIFIILCAICQVLWHNHVSQERERERKRYFLNGANSLFAHCQDKLRHKGN